MIRHTALVALAAVGALGLVGAAQAKGPSSAEVTGPGLGRAIVVRGSGEDGGGSPLARLTEGAGFFPAVFGQVPNPMLPGRPAGNLGPRYTITYTVPGPRTRPAEIRQDLYPYARGGAITYMRPGQKVFSWQRTRGGWFAALWTLKPTLVRAGLPARPPTAGAPDAPFVGTWVYAAGGALMLVLLAAGAATLLRRPRPAPLP